MKFIKILTVAAGLIFSANVFAISGLDFIKLDASSQRKALEPIIYRFVSSGYKNVPDWAELSYEIRKTVLKNGTGYQSLDSVTKEAATKIGMTR